MWAIDGLSLHDCGTVEQDGRAPHITSSPFTPGTRQRSKEVKNMLAKHKNLNMHCQAGIGFLHNQALLM